VTRARDNGKDLSAPSSDLFLAEAGDRSEPPPVLITARIGISQARLLPLRYLIAGNQFVSRAKPG
jgi:3-methyladenine DNA glycosylase Mpg